MGRTHATSAVAVFFATVAFFPVFAFNALGSNSLAVIIVAAIVTAGASLVPDLDNTSSTARNSLGPFGHIASEIIRAISTFIQTVIRTGRDDPEPNAHRGAFHTIPAAALLGLGAFTLSNFGGTVSLPKLGDHSWGYISAMIITFTMCHLALSGLFKPFMRKLNKGFLGELTSFAFSFVISTALFLQIPESVSFQWIGVTVFAGCVIHILGDAFTTSGVPLLFPIPRKGKLWWMVRFTPIKAGGVVENVIFVPLFVIMIAVSLLKMLNLW